MVRIGDGVEYVSQRCGVRVLRVSGCQRRDCQRNEHEHCVENASRSARGE